MTTMDGRTYCSNTGQESANAWPQVYNMTTMDQLLLAGRMVLSSPSSDISQPLETTVQLIEPVDVAIAWLQRELNSYNRDMEQLDLYRLPTPDPADDLLPPTLPLRMRGRVGIREYELQDSERQRELREKVEERKEKLRERMERRRSKKTELRRMEAEERTQAEESRTESGRAERGMKRKSESVECTTDTELHRPKRLRMPNSKYDSAIFVLAPPLRCSQVTPSSPEHRSQ